MKNRVDLALVRVMAAALLVAGCSGGGSSGGSSGGGGTDIPGMKAPAAVPSLNDGSAPSADRQTMEQVLTRAAQEKKSIVLEVSAAWCGPCTMFASDLETNPEALSDLSNRGFILVKGESERSVTTTDLDFLNINDYLPSFISYFPSFYVYNPNTGIWTGIGSFTNYADLQNVLLGLATFTPPTAAEIETILQSSAPTQAQSERAISALYNNFPASYSYGDAKNIINILQKSSNQADFASMLKQMYLPIYVAVGAVSLQTLSVDFPDAAATLTDASQKSSIDLFSKQMAQLARTSGLKLAVSQCAANWQVLRAQLKQGILSAADFQTALAGLDTDAQILCADLELRVTGPTDALKAKVAQIPSAMNNDWYLIAGLGDPTAAINIYHTHYENYVTSYNQDLASLNADLKQAQASNNQTEIAQDQQGIALDNFKLNYHGQIDTAVEAAIKAGQPVQVLSVLN